MTSKLRSSSGKHHDTYWSIPKSPHHAMTFLHFLESGNMTSSQSNMFSHFSFHFRNLWYKLSFTVQSIFGPSIYGINMACTKGCGWLVDGWINCGLWTSISTSQHEDSCETIELSWQILGLITWAEFFVDLGISGLWIFVLRSLQGRFNNKKHSTYFTSRMKAIDSVESDLHCIIQKYRTFQCDIPPGTLDTTISGHIQVGLTESTCCINNTLHTSW